MSIYQHIVRHQLLSNVLYHNLIISYYTVILFVLKNFILNTLKVDSPFGFNALPALTLTFYKAVKSRVLCVKHFLSKLE